MLVGMCPVGADRPPLMRLVTARRKIMPRTPSISVEAYVASVGTKCPVCGTDSQSEPFKYGSTEYDGAEVSQDVACERCGSSWLDVYVLNRYELLETGDAGPTAEQLREQYGQWGEHPDHPLQDWQHEVENDYTRSGYWDWVVNEITCAEGFVRTDTEERVL